MTSLQCQNSTLEQKKASKNIQNVSYNQQNIVRLDQEWSVKACQNYILHPSMLTHCQLQVYDGVFDHD